MKTTINPEALMHFLAEQGFQNTTVIICLPEQEPLVTQTTACGEQYLLPPLVEQAVTQVADSLTVPVIPATIPATELERKQEQEHEFDEEELRWMEEAGNTVRSFR